MTCRMRRTNNSHESLSALSISEDSTGCLPDILHSMRSPLVIALIGIFVILCACSRQKPIIVGSKDTTEQKILAEIIAQQLEHRTEREVKRQFGLGDAGIVYQLLLDKGNWPVSRICRSCHHHRSIKGNPQRRPRRHFRAGAAGAEANREYRLCRSSGI